MYVNSKQKKAGVATHIKEKIDVKSKIVSIEKGLYILIRVRAHKGIKQILELKKKLIAYKGSKGLQ